MTICCASCGFRIACGIDVDVEEKETPLLLVVEEAGFVAGLSGCVADVVA